MDHRARSRSRSRQRGSYRRSRSPLFSRHSQHEPYERQGGEAFRRQRNETFGGFRRNNFNSRPSFHEQKALSYERQRSPEMRRGLASSPHSRDYDSHQRHHSPVRSKLRSPSHHTDIDGPRQAGHRSGKPEPDLLPTPKRVFCGPEGTLVEFDELKKISVEIRRNLPRGVTPMAATNSYHKYDPSDVILVRRPGEGLKPIFDREELKLKPVEERFIKIDQHEDSSKIDHPSDLRGQDFASEREDEEDLRARLMERRLDNSDLFSGPKPERADDHRHNRPKTNYYEHDNRDRYYRGRGGRGRGTGRGRPYLSNPFRGRGNYRGRERSPTWKHDMYDSLDDKPTSTTIN